jgi:hypothetical protein
MSLGASSSTSISLWDNFLMWQVMILPEIRGAQLFGLLDG